MNTRITRTLIALAAAALVLVANPADAASSADEPQLPNPALVVTGNGYGHGHGMSQWGAQGAALQGLPYPSILAFYYPGTTLSSLGGGSVKVLITGDADNNTSVLPARGLRVRDLGNGRTYRLRAPRTPRAWRLATRHGETKVLYRTRRWHVYRTGGRASLAGDGEFYSRRGPVTLRLPTGDRSYRGRLRYTSSDTVNVLSMEKYLRGVVPAEAFTSWQPAALQAQAVAARTYAAFERAAHATGYFHVYDTTRSQAYRGVPIEDPNTDAAIAATSDRVLTYAGQLAFTQFSASNGGWSSDGGRPYLQASPDTYDTAASPHIHWRASVDTARLQAAHPEIGTLTSVRIAAREGGRAFDAGGWVQKVQLTGTGGSKASVEIDGDEFRRIYGLRSAYFTFDSVP
jgi:SpoIID/LytB domain protein